MTVPATLFKYTTGETARIILRTGRMRWSSPDLFNDPAEFRRLPNFSPSLVDAVSELPRVIVSAVTGASSIDMDRLSAPTRFLYGLIEYGISNGINPEDLIEASGIEDQSQDQLYHDRLREFFGDNFTKQARVLCLTANPLNPAMWANYSQIHTGCLLGLKHIPEKDTPLQEAKQVTYHQDVPCIGSGLDFLLYGASRELRSLTIDYICFAKRVEWQYEQEWRVITWRSNEGDPPHGDYPFLPEEIESVTFGLKAPADLVADVTEILDEKYPWCKKYRVQSSHGELQRVQL